jgi:hypothetical protein
MASEATKRDRTNGEPHDEAAEGTAALTALFCQITEQVTGVPAIRRGRDEEIVGLSAESTPLPQPATQTQTREPRSA